MLISKGIITVCSCLRGSLRYAHISGDHCGMLISKGIIAVCSYLRGSLRYAHISGDVININIVKSLLHARKWYRL
jgi:hypothetical protein